MAEAPPPPSSDNEWRVVTCPSCDREIKLPADEEESDMACPYCSAPISGSSSSPTTPGVGTTKKRRLSHAGSRGSDSQPAWDRSPQGDTGDDDVNEYVEVDPNNPDEVRVRRVRRKRTLTPAEKVIRFLGIGFVALATVGCLAILIIALVKGTDTANRDMEVVAQLPAKIQALIDAARVEEQIPTVLTEAETAAAEAMIRGYLEADGWGNKLAFVMNPSELATTMESWYSHPENSDKPTTVGEIKRREKIVDHGRYVIKIAIEKGPGDYQIFALRQTVDDIKIDWEPSVSYQEIPLAEFKKRKPTAPIPFRVIANTSDYYNYEFEDSSRWQCVELSYPLDPTFRIFAYADRNNIALTPFLNQLAGQKVSVIVNLKYPDVSTSAEQVELTDLVSETWFP